MANEVVFIVEPCGLQKNDLIVACFAALYKCLNFSCRAHQEISAAIFTVLV